MIDLHNHSNYSDGLYTPSQVVENAARDGLSALALCDHDSVRGLEEAERRAKELNIGFVPGVELTVNVEKDKDHAREIHMLGLFVKPTAHLQHIYMRTKREQDAFSYDLADKMYKCFGKRVDVDDMKKHFHGALSMGAFGEYMVQKGIIVRFYERRRMTDLMVAMGKMPKQPKFGIAAEEAIEAIHEAGGLAILAHPYRMGLEDKVLFERIKEYKALGLDGLECYYKNYSTHEAEKIDKSLKMAAELGLLVSGGSDYHKDTAHGRFRNGGSVPDYVLSNLQRAHMGERAAGRDWMLGLNRTRVSQQSSEKALLDLLRGQSR